MKDINFELYKIIYEVGIHKNLTKAANKLFISQPAITQQIKKLENELNYKLFYRTKYGVEFTSEGENLFNSIAESMKTLQSIPDNLDKLRNIIANLRFVSSYGNAQMLLTPKIPEILNQYPDMNIILDKYENEGIIQSLTNDYADIALINNKFLNTDNIASYKGITVERVFAASAKYLKKHPISKITKQNITSIPLIVTAQKTLTRSALDNWLAKNGLSITPKLEIDSYNMTLDLVLKDLGITVFDKPYLEEYLKTGELVEIESDIRLPSRSIFVAINKKNAQNKFIKSIVKIITSS